MIALGVSVFVASVLGSLHCAAMCGGFVCAVSAHGRPLASQLAWHAGRGAGYLALGLAAGALGRGLELALVPTGLPRAAAVLAGVLLVGGGLVAWSSALGVRGTASTAPSPFAPLLGRGLRAVRDWPLVARGLAMGALTACLPCGWLWAFVVTAAGTGQAGRGAGVMLAFWLGTLPLLAALGLAAGRALAPLRRRLPLVSATAMIVVGLLTVAGKFRSHDMGPGAMPGMSHAARPQGAMPAAGPREPTHVGR